MYCVGNYYLSSLQQGLQGAHAIVELCVKYQNDIVNLQKLFYWAKNDKTIINVNGGNCNDLNELVNRLKNTEVIFVPFYEDSDSLNGAITSVAILHTGSDMDLFIGSYLEQMQLAR